MLMKVVREGGVCNVDEMVMDSSECYHDFRIKMRAFFYSTRTFVSARKMADIYGIVNRARKHELETQIEILYDNLDYSSPAHINGEHLRIFQYDPPTEVLLYRLLNCADQGQAHRILKPILDNHQDADELITLFGWTPLESDTLEGKRRRIVDNCVGVIGPTAWFQDFCQHHYKEAISNEKE